MHVGSVLLSTLTVFASVVAGVSIQIVHQVCLSVFESLVALWPTRRLSDSGPVISSDRLLISSPCVCTSVLCRFLNHDTKVQIV